MDRQKVAKEAIANFDKAHPNSSSEAKNFYIAGWLDGVQEFYVIMKKIKDLHEAASACFTTTSQDGVPPTQEFYDLVVKQCELELELCELVKRME